MLLEVAVFAFLRNESVGRENDNATSGQFLHVFKHAPAVFFFEVFNYIECHASIKTAVRENVSHLLDIGQKIFVVCAAFSRLIQGGAIAIYSCQVHACKESQWRAVAAAHVQDSFAASQA